jgi:hypothetical protein
VFPKWLFLIKLGLNIALARIFLNEHYSTKGVKLVPDGKLV